MQVNTYFRLNANALPLRCCTRFGFAPFLLPLRRCQGAQRPLISTMHLSREVGDCPAGRGKPIPTTGDHGAGLRRRRIQNAVPKAATESVKAASRDVRSRGILIWLVKARRLLGRRQSHAGAPPPPTLEVPMQKRLTNRTVAMTVLGAPGRDRFGDDVTLDRSEVPA